MSARDRLVLLVLGVAALLVASWILVVSPARKKAGDASTAVTALETQLATARATLRNAQSARASFSANVSAVTALNRAVPGRDDVSGLLRLLEAKGRADGVAFAAIKVNAGAVSATPAPAPPPAAAPGPAGAAKAAASGLTAASLPASTYSLSFSGDFLKLDRYLADVFALTHLAPGVIRVNGRLVNVTLVKFKLAESSTKQIVAELGASAYSLPAGEAPDKVIAALGGSPAAVAQARRAIARAGGPREVPVSRSTAGGHR